MEFTEIKKLYHIEKDCGFPQKTIQKAISKFGSLPSTLLEYYEKLGKHRGLNHALYHLCPPDKLDYLIYGDYLCFYQSSDEPLYWFIDLGKPESGHPPVYRRYFNGSSVCDRLDSESLEDFFHVMAYQQALFHLPYRKNITCPLDRAIKIKQKFQPKPHHAPLWPQFYGNDPGEAICIQEEKTVSSARVLYACTSEVRFEEINTAIKNIMAVSDLQIKI